MAANKLVRFGPVALSNTLTTNILNPGTTTGGVGMPATSTNCYFVLRHIRLVNKTAGAVTVTMYIGATGANTAGTEFLGTALSIAANSFLDWYGVLTLDVADFLVGGASAATSITFEAEGEIGIR
jgi:hypothetical protein